MKTYRMYRMENSKTKNEVFKFYLPEEGVDKKTALSRKANRLKELHDLKRRNFVITAEVLMNREDYLNARLTEAVSDYCKFDKKERSLRTLRAYWSYELTSRSLCRDLEPIIESKREVMKRIVSLVRTLNSEDLSIRNEVAIMLYDQYVREICKGR